MTNAVLTPTVAETATRVGGKLYRKQVLPIGGINYTDPATGATRRLDFTPDYLAKIVDSFNDRAYDAVKFQLADGKNTHTVDPERARGTVRAFELTDTGLDMVIEATADGAKVIDENPDLPVSARIVEGLARADGKTYPVAIQHVLGTLDPRVPGMTPWQAVDLSAEDVPTVDLTASDYTPKEPAMPEEKPSFLAKIGKALGLTDTATEDEIVTALAAAKTDEAAEELTAEEITALEALANEPAEVSLTAEDTQRQIDLANANAEQANARAARLEEQARRSAWDAERTQRLHDGVPAALLDLAAPWCGGDTPTGFIDLANTDTTVESVRDAAAADIRKILDAHKGLIDLSVIGEIEDPDKTAAEATARQDAIRKHRQSAGI